MAEQKKRIRIPILRVKDTDDDKAIYAKLRKRKFTAAEWQQLTDTELGIPIEQVLTDLEAIQHEETQKLRKKKKP